MCSQRTYLSLLECPVNHQEVLLVGLDHVLLQILAKDASKMGTPHVLEGALYCHVLAPSLRLDVCGQVLELSFPATALLSVNAVYEYPLGPRKRVQVFVLVRSQFVAAGAARDTALQPGFDAGFAVDLATAGSRLGIF